MSKILADFSPPVLVSAIHRNLYDLCWELRGSWYQAVFYENEILRRWWSPIPVAFIFNAVTCLQTPKEVDSDLIDETIAFFDSRDREEFDWWPAPEWASENWGQALEGHGLVFEQGGAGMAVDLGTLPENISLPGGVNIERVPDPEGMRTWTETFIRGYGLPAVFESPFLDMMLASLNTTTIASYLARVNGEPVATSSVFFAAGVAGIYNVATIPEWRGKGLGTAITLYPLLEARQRGYQAGILQSSEMGEKVYRRLGFKKLCQMDHYHWQRRNA